MQAFLSSLFVVTYLGGATVLQAQPRLDVDYLRSKSLHLANYLSQCSFSKNKKIQLSDQTQFSGYYGLAPQADQNPLSSTEKKWVSACLLSLTNATGTHVLVALQGVHRNLERLATVRSRFTILEGAFYGDVFSQEKVLYACQGNSAQLRSDLIAKRRLCTLSELGGQSRCGFTITGSCDQVCERYNENTNSYLGCIGLDGKRYDQVITVFLD